MSTKKTVRPNAENRSSIHDFITADLTEDHLAAQGSSNLKRNKLRLSDLHIGPRENAAVMAGYRDVRMGRALSAPQVCVTSDRAPLPWLDGVRECGDGRWMAHRRAHGCSSSAGRIGGLHELPIEG